MPPRKLVTGMMLAAGSLAGSVLVRRRAARKRERVDLYAEDGSMHSFSEGSPEALRLLPIAHELLRRVNREQLGASAARGRLPRRRLPAPLGPPLEVLPRQVPLRDAPRPARPARRGDRGGGRASTSRTPSRLAGPELGAVALAAAASLAGGLPFLIVRKEAKGYGTSNQLEGVYAAGECVCLVEDVVTSGGAAIEAVEALRRAGLQVANAICVVDREEGGVDEFARHAVRLRPLFTASELLEMAAKPLG